MFGVILNNGVWSIRYKDNEGREVRRRLFKKGDKIPPSKQTKAEAQRRAAAWWADHGIQKVSDDEVSIKELFQTFYLDPGVPKGGKTKLSPATVTRRNDILQKLHNWLLNHGGVNDDQPASRITNVVLERYWRLRQKTLSPNGLAREVQTVKRAFNWAIESELLEKSPVTRKVTQASQVSQKEGILEKAWSKEQYEAVLDEAGPDWVKLVIQICWEAGARPGEALNLRPKDINYDRQTLTLDGKTGKRVCPLSQNLAEILQVTSCSILDGRTYNALRIAVKRARVAAGVEQSIYGARHAYALRLAKGNVPIHALKKIMGHANIQTTQLYLDAIDDDDLDIARGVLDGEAGNDFTISAENYHAL